jgi:hypothetical protein
MNSWPLACGTKLNQIEALNIIKRSETIPWEVIYGYLWTFDPATAFCLGFLPFLAVCWRLHQVHLRERKSLRSRKERKALKDWFLPWQS